MGTEIWNKLNSQRLGELQFVSRQTVVTTFAQPDRGLVANRGGLPGTVL